MGFRDNFKFNNFLFIKRTKDFFRDSHSASGFALQFLFLKFGLIKRNFLNVVFTVRSMGLNFSVILMSKKNTDIVGEPLESMSSRICWSFFDNIINHRFDPKVDVGSQILLDLLFLFWHGLSLNIFLLLSDSTLIFYSIQ